jgi:carbonic anhydrase
MRKLVYTILFSFIASIISCRSYQHSTAETPLEILLEGNKRFASNKPNHPHETRKRVEEISSAQHPIAVVVCCSDSRVPPELVFDQGFGDLFVVRTAGNLMSGLEIGSIEYAVEHLGVKQVLIMGHKECGAIKAFISGGEVEGHIKDIVDSIRAEHEIMQIPPDDKDLLNDCIKANVLHGLHQLKIQSKILYEKIIKGELRVDGSCYDLKSGLVNLIKDQDPG